MNKPTILQFDSIGNTSLGYISVCEESKNIPFSIRRVYWTYFTPQDISRGGHANIEKELVLFAVSGIIKVATEMNDGCKETFVLDHPSNGLYIPKLCWHTMRYSHCAVQMVIASSIYSEVDYIRDYDLFLKWK
jgi:hypothetical protein